MIRSVVRCLSRRAEYLLRTPLGLKLADLSEGAFFFFFFFFFFKNIILALEDLRDWPIDRIAHTALIREAWQHRHNVNAYDAFYVAAARVYDASLLTAHGPLTRAPCSGRLSSCRTSGIGSSRHGAGRRSVIRS